MLLTAFSFALFCLWIGLAATRLPWLRALPRLEGGPSPGGDPAPEIVAVIPARNEAATIGPVVAAHRLASYPGAFSIIVVDDHSDDGTASIVAQEAAKLADAPRPTSEKGFNRKIESVSAPALAAGWTGKLAAIDTGLREAARTAPGARYVLLTDADIVLAPQTLTHLVAQAVRSGSALTSLMARLDARGFWGGLLIPAFVQFFYKLYPFHRVNDARDPMAAAAGGCMLVCKDALDAIGGVKAIRGALIDDCALAAAIKATGAPIWLGIAKDETISLRDNRSLASIWSMVSRTAFTQLGRSYLMLAGAVAGMVLLYLAAPAIALSYPLHGNAVAATLCAAAWGVMAASFWPIARLYDQAPWKTFALPLSALFYTLMTISSAINHARGRGGAWKGRTYPS